MNWTDAAAHATGLAHLATAAADGTPHVSMVSAALEGDVLWIGTRASSGKARNIAVNPRVALMWTPTAELYVWGVAELVGDVDERRRVWTSGIFEFDLAPFFGAPERPNFVFVKVRPLAATLLTAADGGIQRQTWVAQTR